MKRIVKELENAILIEEDGQLSKWVKAGVLDRKKLEMEKWLLAENLSLPEDRVQHIKNLDSLSHAERPRDEVIESEIAKIDVLLKEIEGVAK